MALAIRLARGGAKKRPFYRIVVADKRAPRDGRFIEKLGTYNPLLPKDHDDRIRMDTARVSYWLEQGARPTDRVARFLDAADLFKRTPGNNPNKAKPGKKALARLEARKEKEEALKAAAAEAAAKPEAPSEAPAEEPAADAARE